jgi:hypothetical protein
VSIPTGPTSPLPPAIVGAGECVLVVVHIGSRAGTPATAMRIALLTRTCGIFPAATAWYTVDALTRRIAASSRTETHWTDSASTAPGCTKDVPSGRESAAKRCKKGLLPSSEFPTFPATCESERAPTILCESTVTPEARGSSPLHPATPRGRDPATGSRPSSFLVTGAETKDRGSARRESPPFALSLSKGELSGVPARPESLPHRSP